MKKDYKLHKDLRKRLEKFKKKGETIQLKNKLKDSPMGHFPYLLVYLFIS